MPPQARTSTDLQDMRHTCSARGTEAKCHICESDAFQLQGVSWSAMSSNVPSVSDAPWAVGGSHRYDFGGTGTTHVCLHLSAKNCSSAFYKPGDDYSDCELRCWGHGLGSGPSPQAHLEGAGYAPGSDSQGAKTTPWMDPNPTDVWGYPKTLGSEGPRNPRTNPQLAYNPQGYVYTHAGSTGGIKGFVDGASADAR